MSLATYRTSLRAPVRGVWSGAFSPTQGTLAMRTAINFGIGDAWRAGAAECGIKPSEFTQAEITARSVFVTAQWSFIPTFIAWVEQNSRANDGLLRNVQGSRLEMWVNRWNEAKTQASGLACADAKKKWVLGVAEHCTSCVRLSGKVKRNSFWISKGILPRVAGADFLECRGFNCQCSLVTTDEPLSKGPLPKLP